MKATMCYSRDYILFEDQRKWAQEQANKDRHTETINQLRDGVNKQGAKQTERTKTGEFASPK
jgi:hypothetical protein